MTSAHVPGEILANELHAWLQSVPPGSNVEAAQALSGYLAALDRVRLPLEERLRLLDAVGERADQVLRDLASVYLDSPQPLQKDARDALGAASTLTTALAGGYKTAAVEKIVDRSAAAAGRKLAPLLLKSMRYLAGGMRAGYLTYSRVPRGAWKEMHQLYLHAEHAGIANGIADAQSRASIASAYGEALLVALTDPYRLAAGELARIESLMCEMSAAASLGKEAPESLAGAHFLVPCDDDAPAKPLREADDRAVGSSARILDANGIVDALRASRDSADPERAALIAKLIMLWSDPPKRAMRRDPAQGSVAICVGVKPIAHFVAHDASVDGEAEIEKLRRGVTMPLRALPEDETGPIPIHEWAVVNSSAGGVRVRRKASTNYPVSVGEVVGIRSPGKSAWTIGVTRWVTGVEDGTIDFGVQFFANAVCAVWVRDPSPATARTLGLLVAEGEEHTEESLLTLPNTWTDAGEFELRGEGFRSRVRASKLVEKNARFELFQVVPS